MKKQRNIISFDELCDIIFEKLIPKLQSNSGVAIFARKKSKFENWLNVELCNILARHFESDILVPEDTETCSEDGKVKRVDLIIKNSWAIELKIITTNYKYTKNSENIKTKSQNITQQINNLKGDIKKLSEPICEDYETAILFIAFPLEKGNKYWENHISKLKGNIPEKNFKYAEFKFANGIPGILYFIYFSKN